MDNYLAGLATEGVNPETQSIDACTTEEMVELINRQDALVAGAVGAERAHIAQAVDLIYGCFRRGGRLIYLGAGTSGRLGVLDASEWNAIHSGMRMVVENSSAFRNFSVNVAGKAGTAEIGGHPNHALFVGYAPYENPQIALATRITYGYTSSNAAALSRDILDYYFNGSGNVLNGQASEVAGGNDVSD